MSLRASECENVIEVGWHMASSPCGSANLVTINAHPHGEDAVCHPDEDDASQRDSVEFGLHRLEDHAHLGAASEVSLHVRQARDAANALGSFDQVDRLLIFQVLCRQLQTGCVERTALMRNQHDARQAVDIDEELELLNHALLLHVSFGVPRQTRRTAGQRDAVVTRQAQPVLQKIIEVLTDAAVRTIQRGCTDAGGIPVP